MENLTEELTMDNTSSGWALFDALKNDMQAYYNAYSGFGFFGNFSTSKHSIRRRKVGIVHSYRPNRMPSVIHLDIVGGFYVSVDNYHGSAPMVGLCSDTFTYNSKSCVMLLVGGMYKPSATPVKFGYLVLYNLTDGAILDSYSYTGSSMVNDITTLHSVEIEVSTAKNTDIGANYASTRCQVYVDDTAMFPEDWRIFSSNQTIFWARTWYVCYFHYTAAYAGSYSTMLRYDLSCQ